MPRRALRCVADLSLHAVSAPGVWLSSKEDVYLSVSMFGQYRNTQLFTSVFPLLIHEKFRFEKTYYTALDPSEVADYIEDEMVIIELVQLSEYSDGAIRLASVSMNARDFLYPFPSLAPSYSSTDRELLLCRSVAFPGISPKLEFSTRTVIRESVSPSIDALEDAMEMEREQRLLSRSRSRRRSLSPTRRARSPKCDKLNSSVCSVPPSVRDEPEPHYSQPTIASDYRCRSISPTRRLADLDLSDTIDTRPPFVVRKLKSDLIGRTPSSGTDHHALSRGKKPKKTISFSRDDLDLDFTRPSLKIDKVIRSSLMDTPVYKSKLDDEDAEVAALTSSNKYISSLTPRPRSTSPLLYRSSFSDRYGYRYSPTYYSLLADRVRRKLEDERRDARLAELTNSRCYWSPSLGRYRYLPSSYYDTFYDLDLATSVARARSPQSLVHVDRGHYWTERAAQLSGKSHRELFTSNLSKSYNRLYRNSHSLDSSKI